jgi:hypothetical protein
LPRVSGGPYGIDTPAHEVGLPVSVARRSCNSGAPVWNAGGDRQPCRTAVRVHVRVALSDRLAAIVIGTATGLSVWRLGRQTERLVHADLPGGAGDVRGDDVGRVPVQAAGRPVVSHRGPQVRVGGGLLHVTQRHTGVESGGDKGMPQRVRADVLADPGAARDLADDPPGAVPVQPPPVTGEENGAVACPVFWAYQLCR